MIESEIFGRKLLPAVLTRIVVSGVDVRSRKFHLVLVLHPHILQKANDRRKLDRKRDGMNFAIMLFDDFNFAGEKQGEGFLPGYDPEWFVRRV
jgi:hypothetical protein